MARSDPNSPEVPARMLDKGKMRHHSGSGGEENKEDRTIHSGHFMLSRVHDGENDEEEENLGDHDPRGFDFYGANKLPSRTYTFGPRSTHTLAIDASLTKLFECMTLAYSGKITSPKWKPFKGMPLSLKDKVRLNNIIWREWPMQYICGRRPIVCQFATPVSDEVHTKPEAVVLEGKYWKRRLDTVTAEYKKWRKYYKEQVFLHPPDYILVPGSSHDDLLERVRGVSQALPNPSLPQNDIQLTDDDYIMDFTDTLFTTLNQPFAFPNPRELSQSGFADIIQPGLMQLQPNLDEIMDTFDPLQELLNISRSHQQQQQQQESPVIFTSSGGVSAQLDHQNKSPFLPGTMQNVNMGLNMDTDLAFLAMNPSLLQTQPAQLMQSSLPSVTLNALATLAAQFPNFNFPLPLNQAQSMDTGGMSANNNRATQMVVDSTTSHTSQSPHPQQQHQYSINTQTHAFTSSSTNNNNNNMIAPLPSHNQTAFVPKTGNSRMRNRSAPSSMHRSVGPAQPSSPVMQTQQLAGVQGMASPGVQGMASPASQAAKPMPTSSIASPLRVQTKPVSTPSRDHGDKKEGNFAVPQGKPSRTLKHQRWIAPAPCMAAMSSTPPPASGAASSPVAQRNTYLAQLLTTGNYPGAILGVKKEPVSVMATCVSGTSPAVAPAPFRPGIIPATSTPPRAVTIAPASVSVPQPPAHTLGLQTITPSPPGLAIVPNVANFPTSVLLAAANSVASVSMTNTSTQSPKPGLFTPTKTSVSSAQSLLTSSPAPSSPISLSNMGSPASIGSPPMDLGMISSPSPSKSPGIARPKTEEHHIHYREQRKLSHISAEQKRRCNIKSGFDVIHALIPSLSQNPNAKVSKAAMLQKTAEYCKKLKSERTQMQNEAEILKQEIESLNTAINVCQSQLPATGVPVTRQRADQMREMFSEYVKTRTLQNWKFWIFSIIIRSLFDSYNSMVSTVSMDELCRTVLAWLDQHCSLVSLRPTVLNALRHLSTTTSILSDPTKVPEQAKEAVTRQNSSDRPDPT